eukprot:1754903-Rhodomonas_salina.2
MLPDLVACLPLPPLLRPRDPRHHLPCPRIAIPRQYCGLGEIPYHDTPSVSTTRRCQYQNQRQDSAKGHVSTRESMKIRRGSTGIGVKIGVG